MIQKLKNSNILPILLGALLAILFACGIATLKVHAASDTVSITVCYPITANNEYKIASRTLDFTVGVTYEIRPDAIYDTSTDTYLFYWTPSGDSISVGHYVDTYTSGLLPTSSLTYEFVATADISVISIYNYDPNATEYKTIAIYYTAADGVSQSTNIDVAVGKYLVFDSAGIHYEGASEYLVTFPLLANAFYEGVIYEYESTQEPSFIPGERILVESNGPHVYSAYNYLPDLSEKVGVSVCYPNADGQFEDFTFFIDPGVTLEFVYEGIRYYGTYDYILEFGSNTNAYFEGVYVPDSYTIPNGMLPYVLTVEPGETYQFTFYEFSLELPAPSLTLYNRTGVMFFSESHPNAHYIVTIEYADGSKNTRIISPGICEFFPYDFVDKAGDVTIYVQARYTIDWYTTYSEPSNSITWTAAPPIVEEFYLEGNTLHYKFSGSHAVGSLQQNGRNIVENIEAGTYVYEINLSGGLYGFTLTAENKYGKIKSDSVDYYVGFANDTHGTFYSVGVIMDEIVDTLDSISFFGMSLWMYLCTSFVITIIIPLICIIVIPSGAVFSTRGGNYHSRREEREVSSSKRDVSTAKKES